MGTKFTHHLTLVLPHCPSQLLPPSVVTINVTQIVLLPAPAATMTKATVLPAATVVTARPAAATRTAAAATMTAAAATMTAAAATMTAAAATMAVAAAKMTTAPAMAARRLAPLPLARLWACQVLLPPPPL